MDKGSTITPTAHYSLKFTLDEHLGEAKPADGLGMARIEKGETAFLIVFSGFLFSEGSRDECRHANTIAGRVDSLERGKQIVLESLVDPKFGSLRLAASPSVHSSKSFPSSHGTRQYDYLVKDVALGSDGLPERIVLGIGWEGTGRTGISGIVEFARLANSPNQT